MDDNRIPLHIAGLTNSTVQPSSWAVILAESDGPYKIPVVIGASEAQAISIVLNGYTPPRPLTQDLILSISPVSFTQLRAHQPSLPRVCRLLGGKNRGG
ncbi:MAG: bifunctional nuclease family protein, partial [Paramuribaculum sp.]|nr:bifunctional nuclease family protein [Paramuribaculum sp.]